MIPIDPATKEIRIFASHYGLIIVTVSAFISPASSLYSNIPNHMVSCFKSRAISYKKFLNRNVDCSSNSTNPLAQIYLATKSDNKTYTVKDMILQPDKEQFLETIK